MKFIDSFRKNLGMFTGKHDQTIHEKFTDMSHEDLVSTASILQEEYDNLKKNYGNLEKENKLLKNSVINNSSDQDSQFGKFYNNFKSVILDDNATTDKNLNDFKSFLYNEYLFYGGIEENDVNFLNQIKINEDSDWENNKNVFLFKQKILERNYREIFNNLLISNEINKFLQKNNKNKNPIKVKDNYIHQEGKNEKKTSLNDIISSKNEEQENKKINQDLQTSSNSKNIKSPGKTVDDYFDYKSSKEIKNYSSPTQENKKSPVVVNEKRTPILSNNQSSKKQKTLNLLDNLLMDDDEDEEETNFKSLTNSQRPKNKWEEDEN